MAGDVEMRTGEMWTQLRPQPLGRTGTRQISAVKPVQCAAGQVLGRAIARERGLLQLLLQCGDEAIDWMHPMGCWPCTDAHQHRSAHQQRGRTGGRMEGVLRRHSWCSGVQLGRQYSAAC